MFSVDGQVRHTIRECEADHIRVIHGDEAVGKGTHDGLLAKNGGCADMCRNPFGDAQPA